MDCNGDFGFRSIDSTFYGRASVCTYELHVLHKRGLASHFAYFPHGALVRSVYTPLGYHGGATATPSEVVEIRDSGGGFIHGKVTPQTRVNNRPYDVKVEEHLIDCNATYTFNDVQNVPYCTEGSLFGQYIQSEKDIEPLREIAREEEEKGKKKRI
ncbi:hypothetical protein EVAR_30676_1 [Eumeta japonica]|uniref:Uncharacterized protein n=1 Tax=Eumeta variegata TaxID=151549 RepID=A0A4C1VQ36_EUMVA|nr:hypothetical protein EVAR_30676_1 [Eumeta japonica]